MSRADAQLRAQVVADTGDFNRSMGEASRSMGAFKASMAALSAAAAAFTLGALGKFARDSLNAASDLAETTSKVGVVFGDQQQQMLLWAGTAATAMGQSQQSALDAAATFATFGKSAGLTGKDLVGFSTDLAELASDMASFSNTSPQEALDAIGAGLRGEAEPLRRFGVLLDDATLKARAMAMGIYDGTGTLTQQQRVLAAQAEILAQTSDAQGDFARTQGGMANQTRILRAQWADFKTTAGEALIPLATTILPKVNDGLGRMADKLKAEMPRIKAVAEDVAGAVGRLLDKFTGGGDGAQANMDALRNAMGGLGDVAKAAADAGAGLLRWFRDLDADTQKTIAGIAGVVAGLTLLGNRAKANPVTKIGVELTGTVLQATAAGAIGLAFRGLQNRLNIMTVQAQTVRLTGAAVLGAGGGVGVDADAGGTGRGRAGKALGVAGGAVAAAGAVLGLYETANLLAEAWVGTMDEKVTAAMAANRQAAAETAAEFRRLTADQNVNAIANADLSHGYEVAAVRMGEASGAAASGARTLNQVTYEQRLAIDGAASAAQGYIQQVSDSGASTQQLTDAKLAQARAFIDAATAAGVDERAAANLAAAYGLIPETVVTYLLSEKTAAERAIEEHIAQINNVPTEVITRFLIQWEQANPVGEALKGLSFVGGYAASPPTPIGSLPPPPAPPPAVNVTVAQGSPAPAGRWNRQLVGAR